MRLAMQAASALEDAIAASYMTLGAHHTTRGRRSANKDPFHLDRAR
jgi:hypothetical protein